jgi:hypothetical protein
MDVGYQTSLQAKHADLDRRIEDEIHRPLPDPLVLAELKKQKLRIKEELVLH